MIGLFLDDDRMPQDVTWVSYPENIEWIVVRNSNEFDEVFAELHKGGNGEYIISFDHDIQEFDASGKEVTGYTILKQMLGNILGNNLYLPVCYFHTKNVVGQANMECYYENFKHYYKTA